MTFVAEGKGQYPIDREPSPARTKPAVFFNITERENGDIRALQPQSLYRSQQYATAVYRSELALRLKDLGYEIEQGASGQPEIRGYTQEYLEASSPRRQQIKEHLEEHGVSGAGPAQIAAHRTRDDKLDISREEMLERHKAMAREFGNQPERVIKEAQAHEIETPSKEFKEHTTAHAVTYAREKNFEREAVIEERALMRDALRRSMGEASLGQVRAEFNRRIESGELIESPRTQYQPGRAFTTHEMKELERENIRMMRAGLDQHPALVTMETRRTIESVHEHLNHSQREAVDEILANRDRVYGLEGVAGAGKTTSLAAIRDAAEHEGYTVEGFAPTSRAAHQLGEAGIEAMTLQHHLARGEQAHDGEKHLYVLDESSLASTRQMNEFLNRLDRDDRVLLVGDTRQHEGVEAGQPYQQLQETGMRTAHLDEIIRQRDPHLKEAVEQLSQGKIREAVRTLDGQGRVREIENRERRFQEMARDFMRCPEATLVISPDNRSRRELNALIHGEMQDQGRVSTEQHTFRVLEARQELTGADRAWAEQYQPGDVVRYSRGSRVHGVEAGEYATVTATDGKQNLLTVERENGQELTYDPRRLQGVSVYRESERAFAEGDRIQFTAPSKDLHVANREMGTIAGIGEDGEISINTDSGRTLKFNTEDHPHIDYGYAVTSHSSQGQTADRVLIHVDTELGERLVNERMAYVAVSRARYDAQIYTDDKEQLGEALSRELDHSTAVEASYQDGTNTSLEVEHQHHENSESLQDMPPETEGHGEGLAREESIGFEE